MTIRKNESYSLYNLLKIHSNFTQQELERQYHKMCMKYHPDRQKYGSEKYYEISNAYVFLKDKYNRHLYKKFGNWAYELREDPVKLFLFGRLYNKTNFALLKKCFVVFLVLFYIAPVVLTVKAYKPNVPCFSLLLGLVNIVSFLLSYILIYTVVLIKDEIKTYTGYCLISVQVLYRVVLINILGIFCMLKYDFKIDIGKHYIMLPIYIYTIIVILEELIAFFVKGYIDAIDIFKKMITIVTIGISIAIVNFMDLEIAYKVISISGLVSLYIIIARNEVGIFGRIFFAANFFLYCIGCLKSEMFFITCALKCGLIVPLFVVTLAIFLAVAKSRKIVPTSRYFKYPCLEKKPYVSQNGNAHINIFQNSNEFEV
ncbi:hypothetical protein EDEG_00972 [Edhazardia aedis USNM 41457]|uniref:J domain-containing protein n=1 Tax=Edhazardia aedis (strain USNM 41457) TaxID=1003232 RepID=J9DQJ4_EDHAE|nr:hypothetical protein EDEG_00972 [Edhazardia aedis USNM 41457]|eukprot:EJW04835.1 hypothetical protein EDEG_00972 [Edhazardia aedis USNM 41457]